MSPARALRTGWRPGGLYRLPTALGPVPYRVVRADAPRDGRRPALVVALHGFGSDERQAATLLSLDLSGPVVVLAPRAPEGEGGGFSWFGLAVGDRGEVVPRDGALGPARGRVHAVAQAAAAAWRTDPSRTALVGYSQGGALALSVALADPGPFAAVAALAGQAFEPDLAAAEHRPGPPLWVGHGTLDPVVSTDAVRRAVGRMRRAGRDVTLHEAEAPHVVTAGQRAALSVWLDGRIG